MDHLDALLQGAANIEERVAMAKTESARQFFLVQLKQARKEIACEYAFLGGQIPKDIQDIDEEQLFKELFDIP